MGMDLSTYPVDVDHCRCRTKGSSSELARATTVFAV
jgi:hypothetical protein